MKYIKIENLRVGDVVGTTSLSPISVPIKIKTWGWRYAFDQSKANHIATVVESNGLLYFMEMLAGGIHKTNIGEYDHKAPLSHICFVGRHPALDIKDVSDKYNSYMWELHTRHVKNKHDMSYGVDDIFNYILDGTGIRLHDKENSIICSELPRVGFKKVGIWYPPEWEPKCSPKDHQLFNKYENITKEIV